MRKLIYNNQWIVCGYTQDITATQMEERFNKMNPDEAIFLNLNKKEMIPFLLKDAYKEILLILLAALQTGILKSPLNNENFHILAPVSGLVLLPNCTPFNKIINDYNAGKKPFDDQVALVVNAKGIKNSSFSLN